MNNPMSSRLRFFPAVLLVLAVVLLAGCQPSDTPTVTVYKSPTCGCCTAWVRHLEARGFRVRTTDMTDVSGMKRRLGVPATLASCHTAVVNGYVVEGHVPAGLVQRMLAEQPDITGLAVPGMPIGSPGMETPGRPPQPYQVLAFDRRGTRYVYATP
ncbi:MAG: hypothetical protein KatS3mg050_4783 [Litorilinea sp.]|nr:MAG: hypothetical protein KatS3mg050_4783 [Litorilinea sp.]